MLIQSDLYNHLVQYVVFTSGNVLCIYGDPAYPHRPQLQRLFQGPRITQDEKDWNTIMKEHNDTMKLHRLSLPVG